MPSKLYMDVHVPQAVTDQLIRRHVDVVTAIDEELAELPMINCLKDRRNWDESL